jgi:hypothetical protein
MKLYLTFPSGKRAIAESNSEGEDTGAEVASAPSEKRSLSGSLVMASVSIKLKQRDIFTPK